MDTYSYATASPRQEAGNFDIIQELEAIVADFVGKPAAIVYGMGYATNSTTIPVLCGGKVKREKNDLFFFYLLKLFEKKKQKKREL